MNYHKYPWQDLNLRIKKINKPCCRNWGRPMAAKSNHPKAMDNQIWLSKAMGGPWLRTARSNSHCKAKCGGPWLWIAWQFPTLRRAAQCVAPRFGSKLELNQSIKSRSSTLIQLKCKTDPHERHNHLRCQKAKSSREFNVQPKHI